MENNGRAISVLGGYIVAAVLLGTGYRLWEDGGTNLHVPAMVASLACYLVAFAVAIVSSLDDVPDAVKEATSIGALVGSFLAFAACYIAYRFSSYGTDSLLYSAYSAELVTRGINPYAQTMQPAFDLFNVSRSLVTPRADGAAVFAQSYPAMNFLLYVPFALLNMNALWLSVFAHIALIVLLVTVTPRPLKVFAALFLFVDPSYSDYTLGSVTDIVWALPIALAARFWRSNPALAALFLGIACGIKQTPWFVVPFAFVYWSKLALRDRRADAVLRPTAVLALAFFVPNVPFIIADPWLWYVGVCTPIAGNLLAFGSGIVQLVTSNSVLLDARTLFALSIGTYVAMLLLYSANWRKLHFLPFIAPPIALFFGTRSLQNYFMFWPLVLAAYSFSPAQAAAAAERTSAKPRPKPTWIRRHALSIATASASVVLVIGLLAHGTFGAPPLRVAISGYTVDARTHDVDTIVVKVVNGETPHHLNFGVVANGSGMHFGYWSAEPVELQAAQERTIALHAPTLEAEIPPGKIALQVAAIDARTGDQVFSNALATNAVTPGFSNGYVAAWTHDAVAAPIGWDVSSSDAFGGVSRSRIDGREAAQLSVSPPRDAEWRIASMSQNVLGLPNDLIVALRPEMSYSDGDAPEKIFGIEMIDSLGHHAYYTINSQIMHEEIYKRDQFTFFVQPGKLDAWNAIVIDPKELAREAKFLVDDNAQTVFKVIDAQHRGETGELTGWFGGVRSASSSVALVGDQPRNP